MDPKQYLANLKAAGIHVPENIEALLLKEEQELTEVMAVKNGTIDRSWDALPYNYTGPLYVLKEK